MFPALPPGSLDSVIHRLKDVHGHILWLQRFNRFLLLAIGILCVYGGWEIYYLSRPTEINSLVMPKPIARNNAPQKKRIRVEMVRNIFEPYITGADLMQQTSLSIQDLKTKYRIVAVVLDAEAQVIVENLKTQETLFLKLGDQMEEAIIESIEWNRITLRLEGQAFEITS